MDAPKWISDWDNRFDIEAKATGPAAEAQLNLMARQLLADRFQLKVHRSLIGVLSRQVDKPIVDATNFAQLFEFHLSWAPGNARQPSEDNRPSLFTALQEQLGLKLESRKAPVEVLVIDHVEKPSAN